MILLSLRNHRLCRTITRRLTARLSPHTTRGALLARMGDRHNPVYISQISARVFGVQLLLL